jgi:hypothetical protein
MAKETVPATVDDVTLALLREYGVDVEVVIDPSELVDYELVEKDELVNVPFIIVEVLEKYSEEFGGMYAVVRGITYEGQRVVFADGSSGIASQLFQVIEHHNEFRRPIDDDGEKGYSTKIGIPVPGGLKKNQYMTKVVNEKTGEKEAKSATTYRLSASR